MSSELERYVALVTSANVYLNSDEKKYNLDRTITEYCHGVEFIENPLPGIPGSIMTIASDVMKWFNHLRNDGSERVRLHYNPSTRDDIPQNIKTEIIANSSSWLFETQYGDSSRLYINVVNLQKLGISQLWKTYFVLLKGACKNLDDTSLSVNESIEHLDSILTMLCNFADRFEHTKHWVDNFTWSRQILSKSNLSSIDLIPNDIYSKDAYRLLEAALSSWVFGGMGSWNDLAFNGDDANQYTSLTRQLYEAICTSIVSVVNSYP